MAGVGGMPTAINSAAKENCPVVKKADKPLMDDPECQDLIVDIRSHAQIRC